MKTFTLPNLMRYVLGVFFVYISNIPVSPALISGVSKFHNIVDYCISAHSESVSYLNNPYFFNGNCSYYITGYVPSGNYVISYMLGDFISTGILSSPLHIESKYDLGAQQLNFIGNGKVPVTMPSANSYSICLRLLNTETGNAYTIITSTGRNNCAGTVPPSPTPVPDPTSCFINNSNTLTVDLGTLERAKLPTDPAAGSVSQKTIPIPVNCTGGAVSVKMNLSYTAITVAGKNVVKSSTNGLGVGIIYNGQVLAPGANTPLQFNEGANQLNLSFITVRDPSITLADISAGAFSASATLVLTQQ